MFDIKLFGPECLDELTAQAKVSARSRQHRNIHQSYQEPCQRLLNAIEPGSYIRPHRHASDPRSELLIAIRGLMGVVFFDDHGVITNALRLGTERYHDINPCTAVEIPPNTWHTVVALCTDCVLLEIKSGPFDPARPKDLAPWAPEEGLACVPDYLGELTRSINTICN